MTLTDLLETLKTMDADAPLVFSTNETVILGGYHVTEFKAAKVTSIDCAGRTTEWDEAAVQLLDGHGGAHMRVGKFTGILAHSLGAVEALRTASTLVEFAPRNSGLRRYEIAGVKQGSDRVDVRLIDANAVCKPAFAWMTDQGNTPKATSNKGCCS